MVIDEIGICFGVVNFRIDVVDSFVEVSKESFEFLVNCTLRLELRDCFERRVHLVKMRPPGSDAVFQRNIYMWRGLVADGQLGIVTDLFDGLVNGFLDPIFFARAILRSEASSLKDLEQTRQG